MRLAVAFVSFTLVSSCGSTSSPSSTNSPTSPVVQSCASLSQTSVTVPHDKTTVGSITVTAPASCSWTATSTAAFVTVTSGANGSGSGTVAFQVASNTTSSQDRSGSLSIAGQTVTVVQQYCRSTVTPRTVEVPVGGAEFSLAVESKSSCSWDYRFVSDGSLLGRTEWLSFKTPTTGIGNATVVASAGANGGSGRLQTFTFGTGDSVTVAQYGTPINCPSAISAQPSPLSASVSAAGGTLLITIISDPFCSWTPVSQNDFLVIADVVTGVSSGRVTVQVQPNRTGAARTGQVFILGSTTVSPSRIVTITQGAS